MYGHNGERHQVHWRVIDTGGRHWYWSAHSWSPITAVFFLTDGPGNTARLVPGRRGLAASRPSSMSIKPLISLTATDERHWQNVEVLDGACQLFTATEWPFSQTANATLVHYSLMGRLFHLVQRWGDFFFFFVFVFVFFFVFFFFFFFFFFFCVACLPI